VSGTAPVEAAGQKPRAVEPEIAGNEMLFRLVQLGPGEAVTVDYRVRIGVNAATGEQFNSAAAEGTLSSGQKVSTGTARARVVIGRGIFGMQRATIGRVFADANGNGEFDDGELPIANARLFLSNGDSVTTDSAGMYNFPLVNEGSVTISLDPISVVRGYRLIDDGGQVARSWTKLLRTPLGGGALLRQNFALLPPETKDEGGRMKAEGTDNSQVKDQVKPSASSLILHPSSLQNPSSFPLAAGTYELAARDNVVPIAPGAARIDFPAADGVILSAAMRLEATVAEGWTAALELNGEKVSDLLIGERLADHQNKVSTYTFIGVNVRPGINRIRVTAISPEGKPGSWAESTVYGRGPARRLEIVTEKKQLLAGGRESTLVHVRAFDQWNHPASDDQVVIEVSSGVLLSEACGGERLTDPCTIPSNIPVEQSFIQGGQISGSSLRVEDTVGQREGEMDAARRQQKLLLSAGEARVYLIAGNAPGNAELQAQTGQIEARASVRLLPEMRSAILVGMVEATFGRAAPDREWQSIRGNMSSRMSFFYRGSIFGNNLLTLAYDSHRPFHRTAGRDRLYELDPRDRAYTIFGDSSTRFEEARSNSKLYARLDRGASFLMFGDFNPDQDATNINGPSTTRSSAARMLTGYSRNLTGVKLHLENGGGDSITLTGARPNTSFARDVFPGSSFGFLQLSQTQVLPGSENVVLEVRDRRNPEIIISREPFSRSIDYNLDVNTGAIFLLRPISAFDFQLNLLQVVVTYEYSAQGLASAVYTGRATKEFTRLGLRMGASLVNQRQPEVGPFYLGGLDFEKNLPRGGTLLLEWGISRGRVAAGGNLLSTDQINGDHDGQSYRAELNQPLPFYQGTLKASVTQADAGFLNPFGATLAPGSRRAVAIVDLKLRPSSVLRFGLGQERNKTDTVDNQRLTASFGWTEQITSRLRFNAGYDFRKLSGIDQEEISSHLFTIGADWRPTEKLTLAVKREQNLGEADPTYPNQTTLSASYQMSSLARLFFTQRLASAPIVPISDVSNTGFASTGTRNEMAFGIETRMGRFTTLNSRYQIENGINGKDSFAVIGLANKLPISDTVSLELGFERGQHVAGAGASFNAGHFGFSWLPAKNLRTVARYELRDHNGFGQAITLGAAGKLGDDITTLGSFQWAQTKVAGRLNSTMSGTAALALRPLHSDRAALLFSYNRRSLIQQGGAEVMATLDRADTLSTDGLLSLTKQLEFYGRVAVKSGEDGRPDLARVSTLTYMVQGRLQDRFSKQFDVATEFRWLAQPVTGTRRTSLGTELGYWLLPDLRVGVGYNFTGVREPMGNLAAGPGKSGFYFTISSKLSNLFNLFGTSRNELTTTGGSEPKDRQE
jgi:large repetitive protein